jgi:hypothetical protein
VFANVKGINHPCGKDTICVGKDWFSPFLKRNGDMALRKPKGLSRARAQGLNHKAVKNYFDLHRNLYMELNICDKPHLIFNMDETGFPLNNAPLKIVTTKGIRDVVKFTNAESGENVTVLACCSASDAFILPFVIFKGIRFREVYKQDLPTGSDVAMSSAGYINDDIFLQWLQHFQKHWSPGKCLLILDGHSSHSSLMCLNYCRESGIEMLCCLLTRHMSCSPSIELCSSPSRHTTINRQQTLCATILILQIQNLVLENYSPQLGKKARQLGMLSKVLSAKACILLILPLLPKTNFYPLHTFYKIQMTPCQKALIRSHPKTINLNVHQLCSQLQS